MPVWLFLSPARTVMGLVVFMLAVAVLMPRALGILPPLGGVLLYGLWPVLGFGPRPTIKGFPLYLATGIAALAAFSAVWAIDPAESLERAQKLAVVLIPGALFFVACAKTPFSSEEFRRLWFWAPVCFIAACLFMVSEYLSDYTVYRLIRGIPDDQGVAIAVMNRSTVILSAVFLPVLLLARTGDKKILPLIATLSLLLLLFFTESQSAQVAVLLGLGVFLLFPTGHKWAIGGLFSVICLGILTAPFLCSMAFDAFLPLYHTGGDYGWVQKANIMPRLEIWSSVSHYIFGHFFLGSGVEATRSVPAFETQQIFQPGTTLLHPHNAVLQIWMEFGLIGALMACGVVGALLRRVYIMANDNKNGAQMALGLMATLGGVGVIGYGMWQGWWLGLLVFCAGLAVLAANSTKTSENR